MFLSELTPIMREMSQQPLAFMGGFFSGVLRLNLTEEPLKSWLAKQNFRDSKTDSNNNQDNGNTPKTISID
jgi:hypothetical protein